MRILFYLFFLSINLLFAQDLFKAHLHQHDKKFLVMLKKASLQNFNSPNLDNLREKILQKQDLRIKIFGDSHIAADTFAAELRSMIFKPNAIGFTYPLFPNYHFNSLVQLSSKHFEISNSLKNKSLEYPMGGIIARSKNEKAYIFLDSPLSQKNFIVRFVFQSPNHLASFEILDAKGKKIHLSSKNPKKWALSKQYQLTLPIHIKALIRNGMLGGYFIYHQEHNNLIDHLGINGARSDLWLRWNQEIFDQELQALQYDLIIFSYGSNDALNEKFDSETFLHHFATLLRKTKRFNPNAVILLIAPPTVVIKQDANHYALAPNFTPTKKALKKLAQKENLLLFDLDDWMNQTGGKEGWIANKLSKKDVHLTTLGYKITADALYGALLKLLQED